MNKYFKLSNYYEYFKYKLFILIGIFFRFYEKKYIDKYGNLPLKHQPIFIIGAPRTGSTILYQTITNQFDVLYIDNLICNFNRNIFFGFLLSNKFFKNKAHNCFKSNHGNTFSCGLHAPSECGQFWYKWLPKMKHFIDFDEINNDSIEEIRKEISSIINYFNKPLVFKNLNAGQRLRLLKDCFPDAKFIFIQRDPLYTAQSILKSKRKLNIPDNEYWGIKSKNFLELKKMNCWEQIVKQIYYLEAQIKEDLDLFNKKNILELNYSQLGNDLELTMKKCKEFFDLEEKDLFSSMEIKISEKEVLKYDEISKIKYEISKLNWKNYDK